MRRDGIWWYGVRLQLEVPALIVVPSQPSPESLPYVLSRFLYTLYKINPGKHSYIVDATTVPPCSKHFYDRDEAENLVKGSSVYPANYLFQVRFISRPAFTLY